MKLWIPTLAALVLFLLVFRISSDSTVLGDSVNYRYENDNKHVLSDSLQILISHGTLSVTREEEKLMLSNGSTLQSGDVIETQSNQFAVIFFPPDALIIVHPVSKFILKSPSSLHLVSADVQFDSGSSGSALPDTVTCFDTKISQSDSRYMPSAFMMQCRGQSGIILASHKGNQQLDYRNKSFQVSAGDALMGRASSSNFMEAHLPDRPVVTDSPGIEKMQPSDSTYKHRLHWQSIPMADQYLIHITRVNDYPGHIAPEHWFAYQRDRQFSTDTLTSGKYHIRVAAVDYYGVMSNWSVPFIFEQ